MNQKNLKRKIYNRIYLNEKQFFMEFKALEIRLIFMNFLVFSDDK